MNAIDCIIIDEDPQSVEILKEYILKIEFLNLKDTFKTASEAYSMVKTQNIDLIFIDVTLKELDGIQFIEILKEIPYVIIISEKDDYALKGYELHVKDYLLKPVTYERFIKSVNAVFDLIYENKLRAKLPEKEAVLSNIKKDYIFIRTKYRFQKVRFDDILYIQGLSNYLIIKTKNDSIFTLQKFDEIMSHLPAEKFIRIHKSYVVSIDKIDSIHKNILEIGEDKIHIGESYRQIFFEHLKNLDILL